MTQVVTILDYQLGQVIIKTMDYSEDTIADDIREELGHSSFHFMCTDTLNLDAQI
jgi:hypothetical protein